MRPRIRTRGWRLLSSLFDREKDRIKKRAEDSSKSGGIVVVESGKIGLELDPHRPQPDWWHVYMMKKRLEWSKCEDRETVINLFKALRPKVAVDAEGYYNTAEADPRTAAEILDAYGVVGQARRAKE